MEKEGKDDYSSTYCLPPLLRLFVIQPKVISGHVWGSRGGEWLLMLMVTEKRKKEKEEDAFFTTCFSFFSSYFQRPIQDIPFSFSCFEGGLFVLNARSEREEEEDSACDDSTRVISLPIIQWSPWMADEPINSSHARWFAK